MAQIETVISKAGYKRIIQINTPVRFYWDEDGFDGIDIAFKEEPYPWEEEMLAECLEAMISAGE